MDSIGRKWLEREKQSYGKYICFLYLGAGLDDLESLFQPKIFYDSEIKAPMVAWKVQTHQ